MFSYNVCFHAGSCLRDQHEEEPFQHSNNNGKYLAVPKSARIHKTSTSSEDSTHSERVLLEDKSTRESSFSEVNHSENLHQ
jgi:hypothetical protein